MSMASAPGLAPASGQSDVNYCNYNSWFGILLKRGARGCGALSGNSKRKLFAAAYRVTASLTVKGAC